MTDLGGFQDHVARVNLSSGDVNYENVDNEDAQKYIGARGLGVKYVFDNGPDVEVDGPKMPEDTDKSGTLLDPLLIGKVTSY